MAAQLPNVDAFGAARGKGATQASLGRASNLVRPGSNVQFEPRLGVPTFLWTSGNIATPAPAILRPGAPTSTEKPEAAAARNYLTLFGPAYGLDQNDVANAVMTEVHDTGKGPIIVKFRQQVDGIDIFREEIGVLMNRKLEPVAISGYISSTSTPAAVGGLSFSLDNRNAAVNALQDTTLAALTPSQLVASGTRDGYDFFTVSSATGVSLEEPVRMKKVYFHLPEGLEPAYYVEVIAGGTPTDGPHIESVDDSAYAYVISAVDGRVLFRKNLINDAKGAQPAANSQSGNGGSSLAAGGYTYRVWADPVTGVPYDTPAGNGVHPKISAVADGAQYPFLPQNDVTLPNYPFSMNDPWLAPGSVETVGNNADAYVNLINGVSPSYLAANDNGYGPVVAPYDGTKTVANGGGDFRAQSTGANAFQHTQTAGTDPSTAEQRQGGIQQLFYNVNFLHDWYYDAGFNEASGNAQTDNFGRGGLGNDSIKAQAQDINSRNNANMLTPADGGRPRMRMYVFDTSAPKYMEITAPVASAQKFGNVGTYTSGPQAFNFSADVVYESTGCTTITDAVGKIAMVDYTNAAGTSTVCSLGTKLTNVKNGGAIGFILVWQPSVPTTTVNITGVDATWTIPTLNLSWNNAGTVKTLLGSGAVTLHFRRDAGTDRDGTVDNQIVFHEWGHYISNRLIGNSAGLNTNLSGGMGEGWGDFNAMMLTVRENDTATATNANWNGTYALATYATSGGADGDPVNGNNGYYYGIRRVPYSTDMAKDGLTYKHIQDGQAMPAGAQTLGVNSEVHNTGEVWATMLWECYASLLRDTLGANPRLTFQQAQDRMKQYLVAAFKMTPNSPTFLDARDAVLAAAYATDVTDYIAFKQAFAKRGAGIGAVSPDRYTTDNTGVVESFVSGPEISFGSATINDAVASCDHDGVLDSGDVGQVTITLQNIGTTTLTATTGTISSSTSGVSFPNGTSINFPSSDPTGLSTATVTIALAAGLAGAQSIDLHLDFNDTQLTGGARSKDFSFRGNTNTIPAASATDNVEPASIVWTISSNPTYGVIAPWVRKEVTALQHVWHGSDSGTLSDEYLRSPVFTVDGSGSVNVQFDHSWSFEFGGSTYYDGGVVEVSVNGGAFTDLSAAAYNGTIAHQTTSPNPLDSRAAFVGNSGGTVHTSLTRAIAPGSTVQIRFRIGTDSGAGAAGWDVDNIAFTGVVETPFGVLVADTGCALASVTTLATSANPSAAGSPLTLTATVTGGVTPTGTVTFFDGSSPIGTSALNGSGVATYTTSALTAGPHILSAQYGGDTGHQSSTSSTLTETIGKIVSTSSIVASVNRITFSHAVTFTASVQATSGTVNGSVTFLDGSTAIGTFALSSGTAAFTTSSLGTGLHSVTVVYAGNGTYTGSTSTAVTVLVNTGKSDFTAEGKSDVVLQNSSSNAVAGWKMNGATLVQGSPFSTPAAGWHVVATGDLDGDGTADVILQNSNSGAISMWKINGLAMVSGSPISTISTDWRVVGTYDFNHDGKADIILQNNTTGEVDEWQMNGSTIQASGALATPANTWRAVGGAYIGGDSIVLQNNSTGAVARWSINGMTMVSGSPLGTAASSKLIAVGDFNADGTDDLLFQNPSTRGVAIWTLASNGSVAGTAGISTPTLPVDVLGAADYDGDGRSDILLQNTSNNQVSLWQTDGTTLISGTPVSTPAAGWKPVVN